MPRLEVSKPVEAVRVVQPLRSVQAVSNNVRSNQGIRLSDLANLAQESGIDILRKGFEARSGEDYVNPASSELCKILIPADRFAKNERDFEYLITENMATHGFSDAGWEAAKAEGKAALAQCARAKRMISYTELMHQICSISFESPYDSRLPHFLAEISTEEAKAGRGMMTALVVRKNGDQRPGRGFFELAERLGFDSSDREKFWLGQVNKVFASWQKDGEQ